MWHIQEFDYKVFTIKNYNVEASINNIYLQKVTFYLISTTYFEFYFCLYI